jgi:hypothetical protein
MNFLEAVEELKAGRCEGITRWSTFHIVIDSFGFKWEGQGPMFPPPNSITLHDLLSTDWRPYNPKPVTETVERHLVTKDGDCVNCYDDADEIPQSFKNGGGYIIHVVKVERNVPAKIKRREEVLIFDGRERRYLDKEMMLMFSMPQGAKGFMEWEE